MHRRTFTQLTGSWLMAAACRPTVAFSHERSPLDRIGLSTVTFRKRFIGTNENVAADEALTLLEVPAYFADRFGIRNVEFWSRHFESLEPSYLRDLKKVIKKSKSTLINIQLDEKYQLGDPDPDKRAESLQLALRWVDVAQTLGSGAIRVNPGKGNPEYTMDAYRKINEAAKEKGIVLMIENHFGMAMNPELHLRIVQEVGENMYTLPDFGNYDASVRYEALKTVMPHAYQVSAKTTDFDQDMNHTAYDFERCLQIAADSGFQGIYSLEQWSRTPTEISDEAMVDWMIERTKPFCQ